MFQAGPEAQLLENIETFPGDQIDLSPHVQFPGRAVVEIARH